MRQALPFFTLALVAIATVPAYAGADTDPATVKSATIAEVGAPLPSPVWHPQVRVSTVDRPAALPTLYAGLAALQAFDAYSTSRAVANGAHEVNPVMKSVVEKPAIFWSVKAAMAVAPMLAAERLWKTNRTSAILVMAVSNGMMAAVAAHNATVLNRR